MLIRVVGMDPSLRNWGLARGSLDLNTGVLTDLELSLSQPKETKDKQVRKNSKDLEIAQIHGEFLTTALQGAQAIFVEVPVGSQSARAMASYGICVGILGLLRAQGTHFIEVTPREVKKALTGNQEASKASMIATAYQAYPNANWPMGRGKVSDKAEHLADAIGAIHAGVKTLEFSRLRQMLQYTQPIISNTTTP